MRIMGINKITHMHAHRGSRNYARHRPSTCSHCVPYPPVSRIGQMTARHDVRREAQRRPQLLVRRRRHLQPIKVLFTGQLYPECRRNSELLGGRAHSLLQQSCCAGPAFRPDITRGPPKADLRTPARTRLRVRSTATRARSDGSPRGTRRRRSSAVRNPPSASSLVVVD